MCVRVSRAAFVLWTLLFYAAGPSGASEAVKVNPLSSFWECKGTCAATIYGGPLVEINVTPNYGSWFLGGSLSHALVEFSKKAAIEGEVGVGKRFGEMDEAEVWGALYFRWKSFPWNKRITTTFAVSAGLSYASGIADYEVDQSVVGHGSRLLYFLGPEITFALPSKPDWELAIQVHHRSGGGLLWGYSPLSKGVWGASQFLVAGIRHRF